MNLRYAILLALFSPMAGATNEGLSDVVARNRIILQKQTKVSSSVWVIGVELSGSARRALTAALLAAGLRNEVGSATFVPNLREQLRHASLPGRFVLAPKLVLEVTSEASADSGYECRARLSFFEYSSQDSKTFAAQLIWSRNQAFGAPDGEQLEDEILRWLQDTVRDQRPLLRRAVAKPAVSSNTATNLTYSTRWVDPERRRNRIYGAVSVGTPAIFNVHVGYWGTPTVPLVAEVGGMYLNADYRGFEGFGGWAFDNEGAIKQVVGVAANGIGETTVRSSQELDVFGRATSTTTDTLKSVNWYLGPAYRLDWQDFRLEVGAGVGISPRNLSPIRFMFQIGYQPAWGF